MKPSKPNTSFITNQSANPSNKLSNNPGNKYSTHLINKLSNNPGNKYSTHLIVKNISNLISNLISNRGDNFSKKMGIRFLQLIGLFFIQSCSSFFYYPSHEKFYDPKMVRLQQEEVYFNDEAGRKLHAWFFTGKAPIKGTVVFFHGNAQNLTSHFTGLHWLPAEGYSYLIFDYPGYGLSEGTPSPQSTVESGRAAIRWTAKNKTEGKPLFIYGQSLGGNIAMRSVLDVKDDTKMEGVIIDSSFASYKQVARSVLAKHWLTWCLQPLTYLVLSDNYAPQDIGQISPLPLLLFHGHLDGVVDISQSEIIFAAAKEPKKFQHLPFGQHGDTFWSEKQKYRPILLDFLNKYR